MNKKLIRLTESDLHRIVKRSVNKILREASEKDAELAQSMRDNGITPAQYYEDAYDDPYNDGNYPEYEPSEEEMDKYDTEMKKYEKPNKFWRLITKGNDNVHIGFLTLKQAKEYAEQEGLTDLSTIADYYINNAKEYVKRLREIRNMTS